MTSTVRLLDNLSIFQNDQRVAVKFFWDPRSRFGEGVDTFLLAQGAELYSRAKAERLLFQLAITASENADTLHEDIPTIGLQHGAGPSKGKGAENDGE